MTAPPAPIGYLAGASLDPGELARRQGALLPLCRLVQLYWPAIRVAAPGHVGRRPGEVGIDRISTNMICTRAVLTPPSLYGYFDDKYAVIEALGERPMARQNAALEDWDRAVCARRHRFAQGQYRETIAGHCGGHGE